MTTFNVGDRVTWLGFVKPNGGEPERPVGTYGTVTATGAEWRGHAGIVYVQWDGNSFSDTTWVENVATIVTPDREPVLKPMPAPVDSELRERLIRLVTQYAPTNESPEDIVAQARIMETYIQGDTK